MALADVGDHDAGRAGGGPDARRLDHRQHLVAVDLLHQHPGRHHRGLGDVDDLQDPRDADAQAADRRRRARPAGAVGRRRCRSCSTRARSSTGSTRARSSALAAVAAVAFACFLVWELVDNDHPVVDLRLFSSAQFLDRRARAGARLRRVLRQRRADAAVAAAVHRLHGDRGRPGDGAGRAVRDPAVAGGRQDSSAAPIRACSRPPRSSIFGAALFLRSHYNTQADFGYLVRPIIMQGAAMAFFFIPLVTLTLSGLPPERIPAASGPVELRADHGRRVRHVDRDDAVGRPRDPASRAAGRGDQQRRQHRDGAVPAGTAVERHLARPDADRRSTARSTCRRTCSARTTSSTPRRCCSSR